MSFGKKLKNLRENKNLTQEQLAVKIGVSLKTVSRYENDESKPRYRKVYDKIADVLDTDYNYLVTDEENFVLSAREKYGTKGAKDAQEMVEGIIGLMAGGELPEEDKKAILDAIEEAYYLAKLENDKYTSEKNRKDS